MNRQFLLLLGGRVLQSALSILSIRLMTSVLDKENVGYNYLLLSITSWFGLILVNPVGVYLNLNVAQWNREGALRPRFREASGYFLSVALASVPIVLAASALAGVGRGIGMAPLVLTVALWVFLGTWASTLYSTLNMLEHRGAFVALGLLAQAAGLGTAFLLVSTAGATATNWLLGLLAGQVVAGLLAWRYYRMRVFAGGPVAQAPSLFRRELLAFGAPIAVTTVFMWTQNHSYRLIVESARGPEMLANLAVGLGVAASLAGAVESLVTQYLLPSFYSAAASRDPAARADAWNGYFRKAVSVYVPSMVLCLACAQSLMYFLVAKQFHATFPVLMWGVGIELARMIASVVNAVSHAERNTRAAILPYAAGAVSLVVFLAAALVAAPAAWGMAPLLAALLGAGLVTCGAMFVSMRRLLAVGIDFAFAARAVAYSLPMLAGAWFLDDGMGPAGQAASCALLGGYALLVIHRLHKDAAGRPAAP